MTEIRIERDNIPDSVTVRDVFIAAGWGKESEYDLKILQASLKGMTRIYCAYDADKLIGIARVLSDGHTVSQLVDIVVIPSYQKQGIGRKLMAAFIEDYNHTAIYAEGLAGNDDFFAACGLKDRTGMLASFSRAPVAA